MRWREFSKASIRFPKLSHVQRRKKTGVSRPDIDDNYMSADILKEIRILDFTRVLAGPYATRILADFGGEVIKLQSRKTAVGAEDNSKGFLKTWNRKKRAITLDLSFEKAREIVLDLVGICDVVVENYSSRVMSNWGLDYRSLKEKRPDLIMLSMSGTGHTGVWKDYVAFGPTVQSLGGLTWLTSFDKEFPIGPGSSYADLISGLYGAVAVLGALEYRDRTGQGQHIDLSEYEAIATVTGPALLEACMGNSDLFPKGNRSEHVRAAPHGCYRCRGTDRWCVIAVYGDREWKILCDVVGYTELAGDKRFSSVQDRKINADELDKLLEVWTRQYTPEEIVSLLQESGIHSEVVQNAEDLVKDAHLKERKFFVQLDHDKSGDMVSDRSPIRFIDSPEPCRKTAPMLGEDNQYVFKNLLGLTESEFSEYVDKGIIR